MTTSPTTDNVAMVTNVLSDNNRNISNFNNNYIQEAQLLLLRQPIVLRRLE